MALALKDRPAVAEPTGSEPLFDPTGEGTLEDVLRAVEVSLAARGEAHCPVCDGTLTRTLAAEPAECESCGSSLE